MIFDENQVQALIDRPGETLQSEIKQWIDPAIAEGAAKIIKAAFALYNRNGGYLLIGFNDKTLEPDTENAPADVKAVFHQDIIQGLVARYASKPFEVQVAFGERDGNVYPVIAIKPGVQVRQDSADKPTSG
ncbi:putative HTH transcriptional regulator [Bradyrhizobium elkanii]|uniref:hypothetical protein n=1 Tax=Bradyrhizobium elkanii TaxID=29448 RepID=UPI00216A4FA7|nr:hypothetical protein [Bradyrhizobium elkanii]MCS3695187.1 putative HTH transcriptional regulator [Bradyrhizobium elkanii]